MHITCGPLSIKNEPVWNEKKAVHYLGRRETLASAWCWFSFNYHHKKNLISRYTPFMLKT